MRTYTNMTWPDDPYRTGQQLYRRPPPRVAAFTAVPAATGGGLVPGAVAVVYLPLHRTRVVTVTEQTLTFGFRAVSTGDPAEMPGLAATADLDLMQARRHAAILAGHLLAADLAWLRQADGRATWRGLAAVEDEWAERGQAAGRAAMFDCQLDLPGNPSIEQACGNSGIVSHGAARSSADWPADRKAAALALERALVIALLCARHNGRYAWAGMLPAGHVIAAATWDCLPWPVTEPPRAPACEIASPDRVDAARAGTRRSQH